jgi:hypothetical protein
MTKVCPILHLSAICLANNFYYFETSRTLISSWLPNHVQFPHTKLFKKFREKAPNEDTLLSKSGLIKLLITYKSYIMLLPIFLSSMASHFCYFPLYLLFIHLSNWVTDNSAKDNKKVLLFTCQPQHDKQEAIQFVIRIQQKTEHSYLILFILQRNLSST